MDKKSHSTLNTVADDQTTVATTPNALSLDEEHDVKANDLGDVEKESIAESRKEANAKETKYEGEELERVQSSPYPGPIKLLLVSVSVCLAVFLVALDMTIVATAIPQITDEFHSLTQVGWYGSGFFLTLASFQSTWGKGYKYWPLKHVFLFSIFWFEIGSLICVVGPLLGGVFTTDASWRWCFYINLPIGGLSAGLILFFFQTPKQSKPVAAELKEKILQLDLPGSFVFMGAVVCFLLALQWGGATKAWGNSDVVGTLVGGFVIFILFVAIEVYQNERALLVRRLLTNKTIAFACIFQLFNSGAFMVDLYFLPEYFQSVSGVTAAQSGVRNLPFILALSILTIVSGGAITATGHYIPVMIIGAIISTVGTGMIYTLGKSIAMHQYLLSKMLIGSCPDVGSGSSEWIGYQALAGIGIGIAIQVPIIVAQGVVEPTDLSSATAMLLFFQTLAGAIFISIAQTIFSNELVKAVAHNVPSVNAGQVVLTGATDIRSAYPADVVPAIIQSFMDALKNTYILAIACAGLSAVTAFAIAVFDWRTLKGQKVEGAAM
ncbi:MAG: hypothetical protein Q9157_002382 [Trypethelium eluteriae]